ncbi:hypothetical protein F8M41_021048 [Gigaspora margarita]|uniref:Uncharacterized protein n=1 Tax=Gigaspora margarita TaxID=4874 RepID=A0A8H4EJC2_GIGMA|nr:hypothetical protein F8M41_021048 [Gigaspora margarita]
MSESLARFKKETQEKIIQWANEAKLSCENLDEALDSQDEALNSQDEALDPQDWALDPFLIVIEWNDATLLQRQVIKANITNFIAGVNGVQPFTDNNNISNVATPSDSIFTVMDTRTSPKNQIAADVLDYL